MRCSTCRDVFGRAGHKLDGVCDLGWHRVAGELSDAALGSCPGFQILVNNPFLELLVVARIIATEGKPELLCPETNVFQDMPRSFVF